MAETNRAGQKPFKRPPGRPRKVYVPGEIPKGPEDEVSLTGGVTFRSAGRMRLWKRIEERPKDPEPWRELIRWHAKHDPLGKTMPPVLKAAEAHGIDPRLLGGEGVLELAAQVETLMEMTAKQLDDLEPQVMALEGLAEDCKKKAPSLFARVRALQAKARLDPLLYAMYVGRTQISPPDLAKTRFPSATKEFGHLALTPVHARMVDLILNVTRGILECHPRSLKSQLTCMMVGWVVGHDPDQRISYTTGSKRDARDRGDFIEQLFRIDNAMGRRHRAVFPESRLDSARANRRTVLSIRVVRNIIATQPTLQVSAFSEFAEGRGFGWLIGDDLLSHRDITEAATRKANYTKLVGTWLARLDPGARATLLGYPWHAEDALQLVKKWPEFTVLSLPVGDNFEPVMPEIVSAAELRAKHKADPVTFSRLYWLRPVSDEDRVVRRMLYYDPNSEVGRKVQDPPEGGKYPDAREVWMTIDPAGSDKKKADYTAVLRGVLVDRKLYITDGWHRRIAAADNAAVLASYANDGSWGIQRVLIEECGTTMYLIAAMVGLVGAHRLFRTPTEHQSKATRLRAVATLIETGRVLLRGKKLGPGTGGADGMTVADDLRWLKTEVVDFVGEGSGHDDGMDALVNLLTRLRPELESGETVPVVDPEAGLPDRIRWMRRAEERAWKPPPNEDEEAYEPMLAGLGPGWN